MLPAELSKDVWLCGRQISYPNRHERTLLRSTGTDKVLAVLLSTFYESAILDKCLQAYIKMKGDYYFVDNCNCYEPCEVTRYKSQIAEGIWPSGGFFYGPYCPMAKQLNFSDCSRFYRYVSYGLVVIE